MSDSVSKSILLSSHVNLQSDLQPKTADSKLASEGGAGADGAKDKEVIAQIADSGGSSAFQDDKDSEGKKERKVYTVLITECGGEMRCVSVNAANEKAASVAISSNLGDGEEVTSVSESTVPSPPDPNRGVIA